MITCPQIEGGSADESWTGTIRMRRAQCDRTIDTDGDDLADCTEFSLQTEPQNPDTDGDALTDGEEVLTHGTDPRDPDSDDGGVEDGDEVALGTDPLDPTDDPETDCNDGSSNDFDGLADYPVDPGCTSAADGSELGNVECDNGADDDEDGSTDWPADDTCLDATGETETATCELDPQAPTEEDIVRCYAPEVRLHPNERYFPMDIRTFIRRSSLNWAHDKGCADHQIAEQGGIDLIKLGEGDYRHEQKRIGCATHYGERYRSTAYTRPGDEEKAEGLAPREGFYLDLDNDDWKGLRPLSSGEGPTLYYTYRPASSGEAGYITYWFMYGYNRPPLQDVVPHAVDPHEGEWERISVQIDEHGNAERVAYYQHYCDPGLSGQIFDWGELVGQGSVTRETHPVVYSGLGGHASQPSAGTFDGKDYCEMPSTASSAVRTFGHLFTDRTAEGGAVWKTWLRLKDIEQEPWYEFGGAFGDTVSTSALEGNFTALKQLFMYANQTGPLGPPHKSPFAPYGFGP